MMIISWELFSLKKVNLRASCRVRLLWLSRMQKGLYVWDELGNNIIEMKLYGGQVRRPETKTWLET
jgi:hypothetical protein